MKNCYIQKKTHQAAPLLQPVPFWFVLHPLSPYTPRDEEGNEDRAIRPPSLRHGERREKMAALELDHLPHNRNQGEREPASSSEPSYHTENFGLQEYIYFLISSIYVQIKLHTNIQLHCLLGSTSSPPRKLRGRSWLLEVCSLRAPTIHGHFRPYSTISKGKRGIRELF